jgi:hypothetical protein
MRHQCQAPVSSRDFGVRGVGSRRALVALGDVDRSRDVDRQDPVAIQAVLHRVADAKMGA